MIKTLSAALLALFLPLAALAEMAAPTSIGDLLNLMAKELRAAETPYTFNVDYENERIEVVTASDETGVIYPHNLFRTLAAQENGTERQTAFDFHISAILDSYLRETSALSSADLGRIFPVLRHESFIKFEDAGEGTPDILAEEFLGDVKTLFVIDSENSVSYMTASELEDLGLSVEKLSEIAQGNLRLKYDNLQIEGGGLYFLVLDGFYESSFVTFKPLWQTLDQQLGTILMAAPARDLVVFGDADNPELEPALRDLVQQINAEGAYPLSERLFKWQGETWIEHP